MMEDKEENGYVMWLEPRQSFTKWIQAKPYVLRGVSFLDIYLTYRTTYH
jgi:hypothetical protein